MKDFSYEKGTLILNENGRQERVYALPCFPLQSTTSWLTVRNDKNEEVGFVENLMDLKKECRSAMEKYLELYGKNLEIQKVVAIEEDYELRKFEVLIKGGKKRTFFTPLDEWPNHRLGAITFEDISGDLYTISDIEALDEKSRLILNAYVS